MKQTWDSKTIDAMLEHIENLESDIVTDEMIDAACEVVSDLYRVDALRAIEAALSVMYKSQNKNGFNTYQRYNGGGIIDG